MIYADHDSVFNFDLQSITIEIKKKETSFCSKYPPSF